MQRFANYLKRHYGLTPDDVELAETPGYWVIKQPCGGRGKCSSPLHSFMFNEGPTQHTIEYLDDYRGEKGRFISPHRTWRECRKALR